MEPMTIWRVKRFRRRFGVDVMSWRAFWILKITRGILKILGDGLVFKVVCMHIQGGRVENIMKE